MTLELKDEKAEWERPFNLKARNDYSLPRNLAKTITVEKLERRNPGRADGITWNADAFICGGQIEDGDNPEECEDDWNVESAEREMEGQRPMFSISLADVLQPAKSRRSESPGTITFVHTNSYSQGKTRCFETVPTIPQTFVPEDDASISYSGWEDDLEYFDEEEWEQLFCSDESPEEEEQAVPALPLKSYAQALRTNS